MVAMPKRRITHTIVSIAMPHELTNFHYSCLKIQLSVNITTRAGMQQTPGLLAD